MKAITVKYLPQTNMKPARVKAYDMDGNCVVCPYYHIEKRDPYEFAFLAFCKKYGWSGQYARGYTQEGSVFVCIEMDRLITV